MVGQIEARNIAELREQARRRLPRGIFEMIDRGTEDEHALANNLAAFQHIKLLPRVLRDVSCRTVRTTLFGLPAEMPLAVAPTGFAGLAWYEGELALAKAAAAAGVPFTLATRGTTAMERIAAEAGGRLWFQLYASRNIEHSYTLIDRAKAAGVEALIVTADTPVPPNREYNQRNGYSVPFRISTRSAVDIASRPAWFGTVLMRYLLTTGMPKNENSPEPPTAVTRGAREDAWSDSLDWDGLREIRRRWPRVLMLKGVLRPDDAVRAVEAGVEAVVVSNHGGRNLDSTPAPIDALPAIVDALAGRGSVILDSGIRRGSDIVKALALGAEAVLVGRATLYGTAVAGESGASHALAILKSELLRTMGMVGCASLSEITADLVLGVAARPQVRKVA